MKIKFTIFILLVAGSCAFANSRTFFSERFLSGEALRIFYDASNQLVVSPVFQTHIMQSWNNHKNESAFDLLETHSYYALVLEGDCADLPGYATSKTKYMQRLPPLTYKKLKVLLDIPNDAIQWQTIGGKIPEGRICGVPYMKFEIFDYYFYLPPDSVLPIDDNTIVYTLVVSRQTAEKAFARLKQFMPTASNDAPLKTFGGIEERARIYQDILSEIATPLPKNQKPTCMQIETLLPAVHAQKIKNGSIPNPMDSMNLLQPNIKMMELAIELSKYMTVVYKSQAELNEAKKKSQKDLLGSIEKAITITLTAEEQKKVEQTLAQASQGNTEAQMELVRAFLVSVDPEGFYAEHTLDGKANSEDLLQVEPDIEKGLQWLQRAAEGGHPEAMACLGEAYVDGIVPGIGEKKEEGRKLLEESLAKNYSDAGVLLARLWYHGLITGTPNEKKMFECIKRAAELGNGDAQWILGDCYACGKGTEVNSELAMKWHNKGAKKVSHAERHCLWNSKKTLPVYILHRK